MNISKSKRWANDIISENFFKVCGILIISYMISNVPFVLYVIREEASYNHISLSSSFSQLISYNASLSFIILIALYFIRVGIAKYIIKLVRNEEASFYDIINFNGKDYIRCFMAGLCYYICIVCPVILIPGFGIFISIFLFHALALVPYLLADEKYNDLKATEIIKLSYYMMKGYKFAYFLLSFSFILWYLLIHMTYSVAGFYVIPYSLLAHGKFLYDIILENDKKKVNNNGSNSLVECPHCKKLMKEGSIFCSECGHKL